MPRSAVMAALAAATAATLLLAGCSSGSSGDGEDPADAGGTTASGPGTSADPGDSGGSGMPTRNAAVPPAEGSVKVVRTVTEDLASPWGVAPLPEGDLLVSSRDEGTIIRVDGKNGGKTELGEVPGVSPAGEGGLMGLALSPDFASDQFVYAYFTSASDNRVVRMLYDESRPEGEQLGAPDTVFKGIPKGFVHNGGRIAFGPDGMLYAGTGETGAQGQDQAQDKEALGGKILRMTPDGEPVHGNPSADSVVHSWGHRNVQGLAWDSEKRLWAAEFGQDNWDELNQIQPGKNYGWPEVEGKAGESGFVDPVEQWTPDEASPSGIAYAKGSIWMAGLKGARLWRIPLDGVKPVADPEAFLEGEYGRLRTVVAAGGDKLWLVSSETDGRGSPEGGDDRILLLQVT